ncbi:MAG: insulinase family protein, partial [Oscillospiraceae bacterium]|nr:insulinase family protein [Oscillospiraceae bacterium]
EIMRQWELLCSGELTEDELEAAKLALCNSMRSVGDSLQAVENWCVSRVFEESLETPEEAAERLMQYSREEVVAAAKRLVPAAVFSLVGKGQQ